MRAAYCYQMRRDHARAVGICDPLIHALHMRRHGASFSVEAGGGWGGGFLLIYHHIDRVETTVVRALNPQCHAAI